MEEVVELSERQQYWLAHIQACEAAGQSTLEYARAHGFESRAMYKARQLLVEKGAWSIKASGRKSNRFQRAQVAVPQMDNQWRIQLPNGVVVAFSGEVNTKALSEVLKITAALS